MANRFEKYAQEGNRFARYAADFEQPQAGDADGFMGAVSSGVQRTLGALRSTWDTYTGDTAGVEQEALGAQGIAQTPEQRAFSDEVRRRTEQSGDDSVWQGIKNVAGAAADEPLGALHEVAAQLPNSAVTLGGMYVGAKLGAVAGSAAGPVGTVIGGFAGGIIGMLAGNTAVETGYIAQGKADDGTVTADELSEAGHQGFTKGGVITVVDAATLGLNRWIGGGAGRAVEGAIAKTLADRGVDVTSEVAVKAALSTKEIARAATEAGALAFEAAATTGKQAARGAAKFGLETAGEGVGEYTGSAAAGLDASFTEAAMESLLSVPQSVTEMRVAKKLESPGRLTGLVNRAANVPDAPPTQPLSDLPVAERAAAAKAAADQAKADAERLMARPLDPYAATVAEQNAARQAEIDAAMPVRAGPEVNPRLRQQTYPGAAPARQPIPAGPGVARPTGLVNSVAQQTASETPGAAQPAGALPRLPDDPMVVFRDGTVARKGEIEAEVARLEAAGNPQAAADLRAKVLGYAPQDADTQGSAPDTQGSDQKPVAYVDPRLKRESYRAWIQQAVDSDMEAGGGMAVVPSRTYKMGESDKPGEVPLIRTPSVNPGWVQSLLADTGLSVDKVRAAVAKALKGERLGVRQAAAVTAILDQISGERAAPQNLDYARAELERARTLRRRAKMGVDADPFAPGSMDAAPDWLLDEAEYADEMDGTGRAFLELHAEAQALGLSDEAEALLDSQRSDDEIAADLADLIARAKDGRASETGTQENSREQGQGPRTQEAETRVTPEERRELTADRRQKKRLMPRSQERRQGDRRQDIETRKRVEHMTPDELRQALLTDDLTGLGNRRAYNESEKMPIQVAIDLDGLKFINDTYGHDAGDQFIAEFGAAVLAVTGDGYHLSGDEFMVQAINESAAIRIMREIEAAAADIEIAVTITKTGEEATVNGVHFSYGIGQDKAAADKRLYEHKDERKRAGIRKDREPDDGGTVEAPPAAQVQGSAQEEEVAPTPPQSGVSDLGDGIRRGEVGMKLAAGDVVLTATGRKTSPFPKIDTGSNRKTGNTLKRVDAWLMQNAIDEARARGDDFNLRQFEAAKDKPQQADKDSAEYYLFDPDFVQPVPAPITRPLNSRQAPEQDLLGPIPVNEQALADAKREKDAKRNGRRDVPMDAEPGTLFNQGQGDIEDAQDENEYPFGRVAREDQYFGSRVRVLPALRGDTAWEGMVGSVLNGGRLLEVTKDGADFSVRVSGDRIEVLETVTDEQQQASVQKAPASRPAGRPDPGRYSQPRNTSGVEAQKEMAERGGRIAMLRGLNERAGMVYTADEIDNAARENIDAMRDYLIELARQIPGAAEAIKKFGLPEDTAFFYGERGLAKGKIGAAADGVDSNWHDTADAAAAELARFIESARAGRENRASMDAARKSVADKLRAGERPTFDAWKAAFPQLKKGHTYLRQPDISPFLIEHFGFKANNIKAGLGAAAGTVTSDTGAKYPIVYFNKLADVLGQRSEQATTDDTDAADAWDAMREGDRAALASSIGWVTGKGVLDRTGRKIVNSSWDQLSAAAKNLISQRLSGRQDAQPASAPAEKIEDFGEKIEGARKDTWQSYAKRLAGAKNLDTATQPLSKSWPEPDYQALLDEGADPWAVAFIRAMRDEVPDKPRKAWRVRSWAAQVDQLRDMADNILSGETTKELLLGKLSEKEFSRLGGELLGRVDLYQAVGHARSLKGVRLARAEFSLLNGVEYKPAKVFWVVERGAERSAFSNMPQIMGKGDTREQAIQGFVKAVESGILEPKKQTKKQAFDIYSYRGGEKKGRWFIGKKIGKDYVDLESFEDVKAAREYLAGNADKLAEKLERMKYVPAERNENNAPRVGVDHRNGANVTPEQFQETFGFRGVQFGNYVENAKRQQDLNEAYDALMDMAGILNVPTRALSLNGELGLAFGARGKGAAGRQGGAIPAAHYERGEIVINLTKNKGAGSLAHEWWHSLDNYFSRLRSKGDDYATEALDVSLAAREANFHSDGSIRREMILAFGNVVRAVNKSKLIERSRKLDKTRTKAYWSTGREMTARSFESYIIERLKDQGASNDYLANIVSEDYWNAAAALGLEKDGTYPYPEAAEIPDIRAAFDGFFRTVQTKETDRGVAMYSRKADSYETAVDGVLDEEMDQQEAIEVGGTPDVLLAVNAPDLPLYTTGDIIDKVHYDHGLTRAQIKRIPDLLADPVYVFESESQPGSFVVVLDETVRGKPFLAVIHPDRKLKRAQVNFIASAYAKDNANQIKRWAGNGLLRYVNTKKSPGWQTIVGVQFPEMGPAARGSGTKIVTDRDVVNKGGDSALSRKTIQRVAKSSVSDLESVLRKPLSSISKLFPVNVVQSVADLPGNHPADVRGMFANGAVWLVADNLPANEAAAALAHEAVGHLGLETLLGPQMFNDLVKIVQTQKRMGSKRIKAIVAQLEKSYTDADGKYALDARQEAREILAHIAEGEADLLTGSALQKLYQRIKAKVRLWLASKGFGNMEDALIDSLIVRAARMVQGEYRGAGTTEGALAYQRKSQTETPEFRRWFGDSKVVDADGKPLVVYHGSGSKGIESFDPSKAGEILKSDWGDGIYFTPSRWMADGYRLGAAKQLDTEANRLYQEFEDKAKEFGTSPMMMSIDLGFGSEKYDELKRYEVAWRNRLSEIEKGDLGETYGVYVSLQNPLYYAPQDITDPYLARSAKEKGHDGIIITYRDGSGIDEVIAFQPEQIKSATGNRGTFDPNDPNIAYSRRTAEAAYDSNAPINPNPSQRTQGADPFSGIAEQADRDAMLDPLPAEAEKVQSAIEGESPQDAARFIIKNGSKAQATIAERILLQLGRLERAGVNLDLKVAHVGDSVPVSLLRARGLTAWKFATEGHQITVWINGTDVTGKVGMSHETVLHELVHMATVGIVHLGNLKAAAGTKTAQDVTDLYAVTNHVIKHFNQRVADSKAGKVELTDFENRVYKGMNNALRDPDEVLAWALTNADAQSYLESIPYPAHTSAWSAFVSAIRNLLGIPAKVETALSEVLRIAENLMSDNVNDLLGLDTVSGENEAIQAASGSGFAAQENSAYKRKAKHAEAASPSDIEATLFDELRFKAQDKFHYLNKVQKAAMAERGIQALPEAEDAYLAELRYHGMAGAAIEDFQREHVDPLAEAISAAGVGMEDVNLYLQARHAPEANAQLERINPDREDNQALSGMSNEEAAEIMARLDSPAMQDIGRRVDAITKARREMLVESGLETQETVDAWEAAYQHYVPLKREGHDGRLPPRGKGFDTRGKEKRRAGSTKEVVHVLANVVAQYEATAIKAEKVKVGKAFLAFARNNPNPELYEVDKVEYKPTFDAEGLVTYREDRGFVMAPNVLVVRVDGVDHRITFAETNPVAMRIAHALNNLGADASGPIVNALSKLTRWLAIVNTGANPEFVISNFARDLQTAGYNLTATEADGLKWKIIKDVGKAWRGIRAFQKGKHHQWAPHFDEFRKAGAQTGWLQAYSNIEDRERALVQKIRDMGRDTTGLKVKAGLKAVIEFIENENTAVENAIRLSAFVHARRAGMTEAQAAKIAKEMTVNFNRKGDMGQVLNALYLFYNASIQGSVRLLQAVAKSRKVQIMAGATIVFAAILDMINRSLGGDDDDGEAKYDKIPDFVKERNLIIMLPSGGGDYIKIPLPWGYNVLHVMGQGVGEALTQRDFRPGKSAMRVAASAVSAFNPIGGSESLLQFLSPTITDPLVQWAENKDWAGKPLRPASNPFGVDTPNSQKYWNSVRAPSKWLTDTLNELTGGDEVRPGAIDISPESVDLLIDTFTGGAGRFVSDAIATPMKALTGEELETYEVPVLRKVYGAPGMGTVVSDFYERMEAVQITDKQLKHYKGDGAKIAEIRRKHPGEVRLLTDMKLAQSQLRKIRKQIKLYEKSGNESALKIAREREKEIMRRFNKAYNNKMGRFREAS